MAERERPKPARLRDVATRAGVSTTTVSYVLNGRAGQMRISPSTVTKVRAAAEILDYRPNPSARNLRTRTTATVGLVSDHVTDDQYGASTLAGAIRAARELGHLALVVEGGGDPELELGLIEELLDRGVDGLVYATQTTRTIRLPEPLHGRPVVLLNCEDPQRPTPSVVPDDHTAGGAAAEVLRAAGVTDIAVVGAPGADARGLAGPRRVAGIRARLAAADIEPPTMLSCEWTTAAAFDVTTRWLAEGGHVEGVICMSDRVAMGVYQALTEAGLRVPDDVSVVSCDGSALASWLRPALTSLNFPAAELGALAVRRLLTGRDRGHAASLRTTVPMSLRVGGSVRHPP